MYNRLITLGCSLTHHPGWAVYLSQAMGIPLVNLAESSGSNCLQQRRFQELVFNNKVTETDIVIWQITGAERSYLRIKPTLDSLQRKQKEDSHKSVSNIIYSKNIFDQQERIDFLSHSEFAQGYTRKIGFDLEQHLEDLLFYLIAARKMTPHVFVVYGWSTAITEYHQTTLEHYLSQHDIKLMTEPIVNWCHDHKLNFHPDNLHPKHEALNTYCNDYIIPYLKNYLTIPT